MTDLSKYTDDLTAALREDWPTWHPVIVRAVEPVLARIVADAEKRGGLKALLSCADLHCEADKKLIRGTANSLLKALVAGSAA